MTYHFASDKIEDPKPEVEVIFEPHCVKTRIKYPKPRPGSQNEDYYFQDDDSDSE